jgi:hypothetical protein
LKIHYKGLCEISIVPTCGRQNDVHVKISGTYDYILQDSQVELRFQVEFKFLII